jgi:hypothetical protein
VAISGAAAGLAPGLAGPAPGHGPAVGGGGGLAAGADGLWEPAGPALRAISSIAAHGASQDLRKYREIILTLLVL